MLKGPIERDRFFWREFTGFLSGLGYYFRYVGSSRLTNPK